MNVCRLLKANFSASQRKLWETWLIT